MIGSSKFSEIASRYQYRLKNCDMELARRKYSDSVLVLDTDSAPWIEFFVRAELLTPDSDWQMFVLDHHRQFDVVILGNNRLPSWVLAALVKASGVIVSVLDDTFYYPNQIK